jgi:threonylcarbamoyladenosine tRNA methylthiotransferase MtaB
MAITVAFKTWGCKLNQAETEALKEKLFSRFPRLVIGSAEKPANLYVLNACAVTQKAEKEVRQAIHSLRRIYPQALILVAGCFTAGLQEKERKNVHYWIPNQEKEKWDQIILDILLSLSSKISFSSVKKEKDFKKTRFFLEIQNGCQQYCSYCIVPYLRPNLRNKPIVEIIKEIKERQKQGFREIVLVGTNIGNYQDQGCDLIDLLKIILRETDLPRLRLSSLWPTVINSELIDLFSSNPRLCPHFHLSIQSASDRVLKSMGRNYQKKGLDKVIREIMVVPQVNLTADLIVGFPGETKTDFQETCQFVQSHNFLKIHIFRFSPRPGTKAFAQKNQIPSIIKRQRAEQLFFWAQKGANKVKKSYQGQSLPVLIEGQQQEFWQGLASNYLRIFLKSKENLTNRIILVKIKDFKKGFLQGEFLEFLDKK